MGQATLKLMRARPGPVFGWPPLFAELARELHDGMAGRGALVLEDAHQAWAGGPTMSLVGTGLLVGHARELDALLLGELGAASVGVDVAPVRVRLLVSVALAVGAAVAVAGPIGFVGLLAPHLVRLLVGPAHRALLPLSFVGGGVFVVGADVVARTLLAPAEIPVGVVTAALGAPFFLALLLGRRGNLEAG